MFFVLTSGEPPVNSIDLQALTLAGPTGHDTVLIPLAVQSLDNRPNMRDRLPIPFLCTYTTNNQGGICKKAKIKMYFQRLKC